MASIMLYAVGIGLIAILPWAWLSSIVVGCVGILLGGWPLVTGNPSGAVRGVAMGVPNPGNRATGRRINPSNAAVVHSNWIVMFPANLKQSKR